MSAPAYVIGTGYCNDCPANQVQFRRWLANTTRYAAPKRIYVIDAADVVVPPYTLLAAPPQVTWVPVENLGHIGDKEVPPQQLLRGWSAGVLTGALLAYHCHADFIYKEQDTLAFGPWVQRMYQDLGDGDAVFGRLNTDPELRTLRAQSLFLVRQHAIPTFIRLYLDCSGPDHVFLPEHKFTDIFDYQELVTKELSFGYDRSPGDLDVEVFYSQRLTPEQIDYLQKKGRL